MKRGLGIALLLVGCLLAAPRVFAQAPAGGGAGATGNGQNKPAGNGQKPASAPAQANPQTGTPGGSNPFPEDTSTVPVMPNTMTPDIPQGTFGDAESDRLPLPGNDLDPVRSPEGMGAAGSGEPEQESTSDVQSLDTLLPVPGDDQTGKRRKKDEVIEGPPRETPQEDISVGKYYLDEKNWRAALSRFQSALVLDPEEPEVYWGLAESQRHLGQFAEAKANYLKVIEYDPDSRHAKDAHKILEQPEMVNAKAAAGTDTAR
jgi:hypothetical protein